jgi:hypothetical protein
MPGRIVELPYQPLTMKRIWIAALTMSTVLSSAAAQVPDKAPERLFISGHSLLDQPLPSDLAEIAKSLGAPLQWNRQYLLGSSIRSRSAGDNPAAPWSGYRQGDNREGATLDILQELRQPKTVSGGLYDGLLIAEQHGLLGTLVWNDTVRHLRHYHDRFIAANAPGRTWFYEAWLSVSDKDDPRAWIAYERAASPRWQCIAARINHSLQAEGRSDRIEPLPAARALAGLVEQAISTPGLPGVSQGSARQTVDSLFTDDVHLTRLGAYYMALVSYAYLFDRSPLGAWKPEAINPETAAALQQAAWHWSQQERTERRNMGLAQCDDMMRSFVAPYWAYVRATIWRHEGWLTATWLWAKHRWQWHWALRRNAPTNPMRYDAATDKNFWLPAP